MAKLLIHILLSIALVFAISACDSATGALSEEDRSTLEAQSRQDDSGSDDGQEDDGRDGPDAEGPIQALGSSSLTVEGLTFFVTDDTEYDDDIDAFEDLRVGMYVEVDGYTDDGILYAEEIESDDDEGRDDDNDDNDDDDDSDDGDDDSDDDDGDDD